MKNEKRGTMNPINHQQRGVKHAVFLLLAFGLAGCSQPAHGGPTAQILAGDARKFDKSLAVEPGGKLTVDADRGDVQIAGSDQKTVEIHVDREVTRASDAEAAKILKEEELTVTQNGNQISITAHEPPSLRHRMWGHLLRPNLNVHYEITVPRKFDAQVKTLGGGIKAAGLQGAVNVKTMGGGLELDDIDGRVDGETMGGGISAVSCKDELRLHTMGGGITVEKFTGPCVRANTAGGSVSADFAAAPKSDCELHTMGGSVTARIPANAALTLDAHTMGGSVSSDLAVQVQGKVHAGSLKGTINGGGPLLKLETMGGGIEVLKH
jgi:DUF4097 and DUF4098 domain-containing protein YvlB